jgi:exopolysaccharide biosynthesis polyprenyl glycosylphosphotransferase
VFFRRTFLLIIYKLSDIVILLCSLALALCIGGYEGKPLSLSALYSDRMTVLDFIVIIITIFIWHVLFQYNGLYLTKRLERKLEECIDILKAISLGTCVISCMASFFYIGLFNSYFIIVFWVLATILTISTRMTMRLILIVVRYKDRNLRHIVILGTNEQAIQIAEKIQAHKEMGYKILGFVGNEEFKGDAKRLELISDLDHFSEVLDQHVVDEVVVALPIQSFYREIREVLKLCQEQGIKCRFIMGTLLDLSHTKMTVEYLDGEPLLTLYMGPHDGFLLRIKRIIDIIISILALTLLAPLFVIIGILIKIDSRGPIFFVQERVGYNKRLFAFYKFRTMKSDAEKSQAKIEHLNEVSGPVFKIKNDPRVTKIGKILRKTSIDELPQFFNVLKGEMSLVGPRPLPIRDYKRFEQNWQKRRLSVRPGITCLWQIQGRSGLSFDKWIELDMEYIDQWSLLLDFKILVKTIPAVLRGTGAM